MKILFVVDNFPPELNAPATRTFEHCIEWQKMGHQVTIITGIPNFPMGKVYKGYTNRIYQREVIDDLNVVRVWTFIAENAGTIKRSIDHASFAVSSFIAGITQRFDVVVSTSPQFFTCFSGFLLSSLRRKPWVLEIRDIWPESVVVVGAMKKNAAIRMLERCENFFYKKADLVVTVTEGLREQLIEKGVHHEKMLTIPNGVDLEKLSLEKAVTNKKVELGLSQKFVIGYIGTHGMAHGLSFILNCASKIHRPEVHFVFFGDGSEKLKLVDLAEKLNLQNVTFLDPVDKSEIVSAFSAIDIALVPLKKTKMFESALPSKMFEAAAMNKPILLGVEGLAKKIIEKYSAGISYVPEDEVSFLSAVEQYLEASSDMHQLKQGCSLLAKDFDRKKLAVNMIDRIFDEFSSK